MSCLSSAPEPVVDACAASLDDMGVMLVNAALEGELESVIYLVEEERVSLEVTDAEGSTPLMAAAFYGRSSVVSYLLGRGAIVDAKNASFNWTALVAAAYKGSPETVAALLQAGADPSHKDVDVSVSRMASRETSA